MKIPPLLNLGQALKKLCLKPTKPPVSRFYLICEA